MSDETRKALEDVVGIVSRLGASQRARSAQSAERKDFAGCVTYEHGAMVCDQIVRLIQDVVEEQGAPTTMELESYRRIVVGALSQMADVEARLAQAAHPLDEVSEECMHQHAETCLREAARAIEEVTRE